MRVLCSWQCRLLTCWACIAGDDVSPLPAVLFLCHRLCVWSQMRQQEMAATFALKQLTSLCEHRRARAVLARWMQRG